MRKSGVFGGFDGNLPAFFIGQSLGRALKSPNQFLGPEIIGQMTVSSLSIAQ